MQSIRHGFAGLVQAYRIPITCIAVAGALITAVSHAPGGLEVKLSIEGKPCIGSSVYLVAQPNSNEPVLNTFYVTTPSGKTVNSSGATKGEARTEFTPASQGIHTLTVNVNYSRYEAHAVKKFNVENCNR